MQPQVIDHVPQADAHHDQIQPSQVNLTPTPMEDLETVAQKLSRQEKAHYGLDGGLQADATHE